MSHFYRLVLTLIIIFISLGAGYIVQWLANSERAPIRPATLSIVRLRLQAFAVFVLLPFSALLSLWGLKSPDPELLVLPFLGLLTYITGGALALLAARLLGMNQTQSGSFFCCGSFNNIGAIGGLVCLVFLGEESIALVALYRVLEDIYYFGVAFPVARHFALTLSEQPKWGRLNASVLLVIVLALLFGLFLNFMHIPRPDAFNFLASSAMLLATILFLFSIGLSMRLGDVGAYLKPALVMCVIKFVIVPIFITLVAFYSGLEIFDKGLALKVVAILAAMPVAMTALVPPSLFGLDLNLANACWLCTTACLIIVLPVLFWLLPLL